MKRSLKILIFICVTLAVGGLARRWYLFSNMEKPVEPYVLSAPVKREAPIVVPRAPRPVIEEEPAEPVVIMAPKPVIDQEDQAKKRRIRFLNDRIASRERGLGILGGEMDDKEAAIAQLENRHARTRESLTAWMNELARSGVNSQREWDARGQVSGSAGKMRELSGRLKHSYEVMYSLERRYAECLRELKDAERELAGLIQAAN